MDRIRLRHVLTHLHDVITNDIPGLSFRMWFYGSRQRGTEHADSDVDLAIETLSPMEDGEALAHWMYFHKGWERFLSGELGLAVQIELYRGLDFTPAVHAALEESSEVIYESAPTPSE
jgi:predicted nucleotidyltransferase